MCDKIAISAYILKIVEKDSFLRLQRRAKEMSPNVYEQKLPFCQTFCPPPPPQKKNVKKEMFNRHQFFSTNKQYIKIKLMQNEKNL